MNLKKLRLEKKITQKEAADIVGISLRSYKMYENDTSRVGTLKYNYIRQQLLEFNRIDEENGILNIEDIIAQCKLVFENYDVEFCYLFGSYAKNIARENSDVDLLISCEVKGLKFYELVEELRTQLKKKVDLLDVKQLEGNINLVCEVLKDGVKIYG